MSLYSVAHTGGANRVALISAPSSLKRELNRFAVGRRPLRTRHGRPSSPRSKLMSAGRRRTSTSAASRGKVDLPLLLVHDQNDRQVPVLESARTAHVLPGAELMVTRGLGHNRLLADPVVVRAVVDFVAQETPTQETMGSACTM